MTDKNTPSPRAVFAGDLLKEARMARGLSLEEVSTILRINKAQLLQLEEAKESLVCNIYTLGFLKSYAQFLELNSAALLQAFKEQTSTSLHPCRLNFPTPPLEKGIPDRRIVILSLIGFICVLIGCAWWDAESPGLSVVPTPAPPPALLPQKKPPTPKLPPEHRAAPGPRPVQLIAIEETWVEVKNGKGEILLRRLLHQGQTHTFANPQDLILRTGNAGGVKLISGDALLEFPKEKGMVRSHILLDATRWVEGTEGLPQKPDAPLPQ